MIEVTDEMREYFNNELWDINFDHPKWEQHTSRVMKRIIELHEANKPKPEPVAYRWWNQGCNCDECDQYFYSEDPDFISKNREPLYTTPPTREPFSEEFLMALAEECTAQFFNGVHQNATIHFARAVEQAHGIGTSHEPT